MKMTKKILLAAVAVAAVMFAGCKKEIGDINWGSALGSGDGTQTYKVNQLNESKSTIRGMKKVGALQRAQGTAVVQMFDQDATSYDGMVGFAACVTQNKDKDEEGNELENYGTYNFLVVGVQNKNGKVQTYASYFCNIAADKMSTQNFGCSKTEEKVDPKILTPYEIVIKSYPTQLTASKFLKDGKVSCAIKFDGDTDGGFKIEWFDPSQYTEQTAVASLKYIDGATPALTANVSAEKLGRNSESDKGSLWAYANIYGGRRLNGRWDFYDISWKQSVAAYVSEPEFGDIDWQ
ncbi:MAG: hypothetical protein SO112_09700 [Treponema sp.]|nr:hypothetical protein [Treponema sp.]